MGGILGLCLFPGCQHPDHNYGQPNESDLQWREMAESARRNSLPVADEVPERIEGDAEEQAVEEALVDLPDVTVEELKLVRETEMTVFLRAMARGAGINLLVGEGVAGEVRLRLEQPAPWDRLFREVVASHGLHYEWDGQLLKVLSMEDIQRRIQMEDSLKELNTARNERFANEPVDLGLYRVRYAATDRLAGSILAGMGDLSTDEEAPVASKLKIVPDVDSGLLIIHAPPRQLDKVLKLARSLDQPAYQVLIEATIVQTNSETARDLGFQWGWFDPTLDSNRIQLGTGVGDPLGWDGINSDFPASFGEEGTGFTLGLVSTSNSGQILRAQLSALQRDGRLEIISNPSVITLDKQVARIESGEERPFQSASGTGATATATVEFKEALLSLEVTPQVIDGEWVKLKIDTTKDEFDDSRAIIIEGTLQVPVITRAASTQLYLENGQTTVIGGLSSTIANDTVSGIPFLKDLPLVGAAFRNTVTRSNFSDTLIFITPTILPAEEIPDRNRKEEASK